jgi:threonylcarbamoyladenosine tRNA methylthiotransferase MtaB
MEDVDLVIGNTGKGDIVRQVMERRDDAPVPCAVGDDEAPFSPRIARTRAMVKIQEGCNQVCAFCIVPKVRGRERSVPPDDIIGRIDGYVASGYREVVLTGTQLGSYGFDLPGIDLRGLLSRVLSETGIERLRVSSLQPQEIEPRLLGLWADPRLCPHFHIPLQSGSDAVLKRMRRRYTAGRYLETVDMVREAVPDVSITTDVIVGFPGESEEDFQATYAVCDRTGFASMHVFPYSVRPGTSAAHLDDSVDADTRSTRMASLLALSRRHAMAFRSKFLGATRPVLWEERKEAARDERWSGLTDNYIRVVGLSTRPLANEITAALLVKHEQDLVFAQVLQ